MHRPLRIAVIGAGFGQQVHVPAFRSDPRCHVTTLCASTLSKARQIADLLTIPYAADDWRAVVAHPEIDAVSIAVPPRLQPAIAAQAFRHGKAVFCEKPLAASLSDAQTARDAAARAGLPNMINFEFSACDAWVEAGKIIAAGRIGRVQSIDVQWTVQTYANRNRLENWKSRPTEGGGALAAFVAHTFYSLESFGGPIARLNAQLRKSTSDPRDGETKVMIEGNFAGGARATIHVETDSPPPPPPPPPHRHSVHIVGDSGALQIVNEGADYIAGFRLLQASPPGAKMTPLPGQASTCGEGPMDGRTVATARLVRKFVDWIVDGTPNRPTFADGCRVQFLIEAARRSDAAGRSMDTLP